MFKSLLQIIGMKCDGKVAVDLDNMIGKSLNINVTHEEYNGQIRARVSDYLKPGAAKSDDDDEDEDSFDEEDVTEDEEEKPAPKKKAPAKKAPAKKTKKKPEPVEEDDEDDDDDWEEE